MNDPALFEPWFCGASWDAWRIVLRAMAALPMTEVECATFRALAGRDPAGGPVRETWIIAGRRCGKDSVASLVAAHMAAFFDPEGRLRRGERAVVLCLAVDRDQAQIVLRYIRSYFRDIGFLRRMVTRETVTGLELSNAVDMVVATNDYRVVRGRPVLCAILDECAFWAGEHSFAPDTETYNAIVPGTATLPGALIIGISTPHRRGGLLHSKWQESYGVDGDVLVIRAPSLALNPTLDPVLIEREPKRDPPVGRGGWRGGWRDDVAAYLDRALIEAAVDAGVTARPPQPGVRFRAFCDASAGISDSFTLAVAHKQAEVVVLDHLTEITAPFDPSVAVARLVGVLREFGLTEIFGDRYAGMWVSDAFRAHHIDYRPSELNRSQLYADCLPLFTASKVRLLDQPRLIAQFCALERKAVAGRADVFDHPRGAGHHDDCANSAAGALVLAGTTRYDVPVAGLWWHVYGERREVELWGRNASPPCTLTAEQLRATEPSDETVRRWRQHAEYLQTKAAEEQRQRSRDEHANAGQNFNSSRQR